MRARLPLPPPAPAPSASGGGGGDDDDDEEEDEEDDPAAPGWLSGGGKSLAGDRAWGAGGSADGGDSSDNEDNEESSDDDDGGEEEETDAPAATTATAIAAADETLPDGAPAPLGFRRAKSSHSNNSTIQPLATTSALPRARWAVLPHLDALAARNRPLEPPKKPEAAPFFLPTLPTLDGRPTFDVVVEDEEGEEDEEENHNKRSRVERGFAGNASAGGELVAALRAGRKRASTLSSSNSSSSSSDLRASLDAWSLASKWLRTARPHEIDRELRSMLVLEPEEEEEEEEEDDDDDDDDDGDGGRNKPRGRIADEEAASVAAAADTAAADLESLLLFLRARCASGADFELIQAFLTATLALHGASIAARPRLRRAAANLEKAVRVAWERLDDSLHAVRCSAAYVGGLPS